MKPLFTIHEGEFLVGDHINRRLGRRFEVFVPSKDEGTDLLLVPRDRKGCPIRLQVKFSRSFDGVVKSGRIPAAHFKARGWWTLKPAKIRKSPADFWVFVIMNYRHEAHFVIIPTQELRRRAPRHARIWHIYLTVLSNRRCYDLRGFKKSEETTAALTGLDDPRRDYSAFLDGWPAIVRFTKFR